MGPAITLPRLIFGTGALASLGAELALLGVERPFLVSDRGLERAGLVARVEAVTAIVASFLGVPENPTAAGVDASVEAYRAGDCDGVVALGGGSVLDTAKLVAALVGSDRTAVDIIGRYDLITAVAPLIAIPTTVGTGSESSPVAAVHRDSQGPAIGTRGPMLVPRVALCDPDLTRTLPRRLIAATAIDALSHCIEGYFADPPNPVVDALALDGIARVFAGVHAALEPDGDAARASLMAAAFAGGAAIHKGLGPAHAVALACGEADIHHGTLIGVALPHTLRLLTRHVPAKAARIAAVLGTGDIADAVAALIASLGLPSTLPGAGHRGAVTEALIAAMVASHFNRSSPYAPSATEYRAIADAIAA